ncbi:sulfurtransferase [Acuticoccus sp. M5D2P5]|uniref:sulfurtransferase n=1 Tax=Acuticoccus kalidii TaxID=2910977 RepID=UPI001F3BB395|nr:rhodanese-like domain-containing protein [Acuticoccus kalidii]MCF3931958.1 sulfurtransferase [Acuticoccus kalidii]
MRRITLAALAAIVSASTAAFAADTEWKPLISPEDLASFADGSVTIVDIRDPKAFATAHLPGAVNAPYEDWRGPADNPGAVLSDEALTALLQSAGLRTDNTVIVTHAGVDQTDFGAAARVYWTLKSAGFPQIAILNGGVRGWIADGQSLQVTADAVEPSDESFTMSDEWMIDREGIAAVIAGERQATLVDARPDDFFAGAKKHAAASSAGTLQGAKSFPFAAWFEGSDTEVAGADATTVAANAPAAEGETVSFCNTGHWAATNWFAMSELAGKKNVKLYPESMVGWTNAGGDAVSGE